MAKRIYLAGPEVFCRDPTVIEEAKKGLCQRRGFEGVFPLDANLDLDNLSPRDAGVRISLANEELILSCDLLIANMTPFRGPSMDVGTAFEMGYMRALKRPVLGYTNISGTLLERTQTLFGSLIHRREDTEKFEDEHEMEVEEFGMVDNLMIHGAVLSSNSEVIVVTTKRGGLFTDLSGFEKCVEMAANLV